MSGQLNDRMRLAHIIEFIDYALKGAAKIGDEKLEDGDLRYFGLMQLVQTVGEAAYKLTRDFRAQYPQVPWQQIIGMRHIIVHEYKNVEEGIIWRVVKEDLPLLRNQVIQLLNNLPE